MKTAVVYYTLDGSTKVAAEVLAEKFCGDIFALEEARQRGHKPSAFMGAAFAAIIGKKSRLKDNYAKEMPEYDRICIGTPIWASKATPAVNTFVGALDATGMDIIIFTVQSDNAPGTSVTKGADIIKKTLEKKDAEISRIFTILGAQPGNTADREAVQNQIEEQMD